MTTTHELRFEETGRSIAHASASAQASATWEVHDLLEDIDVAEYVVDSGAATMDATSIALTSEAGPGTSNARRLLVASTAGVTVGDDYLVTATDGSELVVVSGLSTDTYVDLEHTLAGTYTVANAATLRGVTMSAALSDTIAATQDYVDYDEPLRIVWQYANGERHQQQIRVVREDYDDFDIAGVSKSIRRLFPDVYTRAEHHGVDTLRDLVLEVYDMVNAEALADGETPERLLHGAQGQKVLVWATLRHLAAMGNAPGQQDTDEWMVYTTERYRTFYANVKQVGKAGARTVSVIPGSESAAGTTDPLHRQRLRYV